MDECSVPIFFVRFEELMDYPERVMKSVYSFILGVKEDVVEASILGQKLREVCNSNKADDHFTLDETFLSQVSLDGAAKKTDATQKNINCFKDSEIARVKEVLSRELHYFGYASFTGNRYTDEMSLMQGGQQSTPTLENKYQFFHYNKADESRIGKDRELQDAFRMHN